MDKPEDLNPNGTLFGVALIDEELALYSIIQLENQRVVTKYMSEINFRSLQKTRRYYSIDVEV
jgi:acyl-CoA hydrolase